MVTVEPVALARAWFRATISAMLGHGAVTTTIRYLGLKDENLKQAGDILASKYRAPAEEENVRNRVQSVPESVPQTNENELDRNAKTSC